MEIHWKTFRAAADAISKAEYPDNFIWDRHTPYDLYYGEAADESDLSQSTSLTGGLSAEYRSVFTSAGWASDGIYGELLLAQHGLEKMADTAKKAEDKNVENVFQAFPRSNPHP
jgi:hypothetical protein